MKKYKVTGLPKAQDGKNLKGFKKRLSRRNYGKDISTEPVAPPSPENAVDFSGSDYPSFWDTQSTMVNPQAAQFPTYEVADQGLGDRTVQEQINTLPNIYGDNPYKDYWKDLDESGHTTDQPTQCPEGMAPFKGECFPEEVAAELYQKLQEEEWADPNTSWNQTMGNIEQLRQDIFQDTELLQSKAYMDKFINSDKHDKIEPYTILKYEKMLNSDPELVKEAIEMYDPSIFYMEKASNGDIKVYPRSVIEDRIWHNGFRADDFKKDWGLNPEQVKEEFGVSMEEAQIAYDNRMITDIFDKAIDKGLTPKEIIDAMPEVSRKGYREKIRRYEENVNQSINDIFEQYKKNILSSTETGLSELPKFMTGTAASQDEIDYAHNVLGRSVAVNVIPGEFDNDPGFQEFKNNRTYANASLLKPSPPPKFDWYEDRNVEYKMPKTYYEGLGLGYLWDEYFGGGIDKKQVIKDWEEGERQAALAKAGKLKTLYGRDLDDFHTETVENPFEAYYRNWVQYGDGDNSGQSDADVDKRSKKLHEIKNKDYSNDPRLAEFKEEYKKNFGTGFGDPYHLNIPSHIGMDQMGDIQATRYDRNQADYNRRYDNSLKAKIEELRTQDLNKLTGAGESFQSWMFQQPEIQEEVNRIVNEGFNNPDLTLRNKVNFLHTVDLLDKEKDPDKRAELEDDLYTSILGPNFLDGVYNMERYLDIINKRDNQVTVSALPSYYNPKNLELRDMIKDASANVDILGMDLLHTYLPGLFGTPGHKFGDDFMWNTPIHDQFGNQQRYSTLYEKQRSGLLPEGTLYQTSWYNPLGWLNNVSPANWIDKMQQTEEPLLDRGADLFHDAVTSAIPIGRIGKLAKGAQSLKGLGTAKGLWQGTKGLGKEYFSKTNPYWQYETWKPGGFLDQALEHYNYGNYKLAALYGLPPLINAGSRALNLATRMPIDFTPRLRSLYPEGTQYATNAEQFRQLTGLQTPGSVFRRSDPGMIPDLGKKYYKSLFTQVHPDKPGGSNQASQLLGDMYTGEGYQYIPFNANMQTGIIAPKYQLGRWSAGPNVFKPRTLEEMLQLQQAMPSINRGFLLPKKEGGVVLKLDQNEIDQYIKDGYVVEDV